MKHPELKLAFNQCPQRLRLHAALISSRLWVLLGNAGAANAHAMQAMPISVDLNVWLNDSSPCKVEK